MAADHDQQCIEVHVMTPTLTHLCGILFIALLAAYAGWCWIVAVAS